MKECNQCNNEGFYEATGSPCVYCLTGKLQAELMMYKEDAVELIEKYGGDLDDKVDREVLKRMLNSLIHKNRGLQAESEELKNRIQAVRDLINNNNQVSKWKILNWLEEQVLKGDK